MAILYLKTNTKNDKSTDKTVSAFLSFFMPKLMASRMSAWDIGHLFVAGWETASPHVGSWFEERSKRCIYFGVESAGCMVAT